MEPIHLRLISFLIVLCMASGVFAQDSQSDQPPPRSAIARPINGPSLTVKERMGRKWMDEQRIDNCNVPADKRGSKPRPSNCLHSRSD